MHDRSASGSFWLTTIVLGVAGGALVGLFAFLLARYGPSGDTWSFRGNGALAAYTVAPALLAGGWTALVARLKGRRDWTQLGLGATLIGLALAVVDAVLLSVGGSSVVLSAIGAVLLLAVLAWSLLAPALTWALARPGTAPRLGGGYFAAALGLWIGGLIAGLLVLGLVLPAGS